MPEVLDTRALNRALLARQHLLEPTSLSPLALVEHLVGLQAQQPNDPYVALWTRSRAFRTDSLSAHVADREAVRIAVMRSTIHLVSARDALALRPLLQPMLERAFDGVYGRRVAGLDRDAIAAHARALVEERARTFAELGAELAERWPERDPASLAAVARTKLALVQVPPRGLWGGKGQAKHTTAEQWLGRALDPDALSLDRLVLRYLAAFGPASALDAQTWSGLASLKDVFERLRPSLRVFHDERGRELFDLDDAPRPAPDVPAPVRFLPQFDNVLLSHAERARIVSDERRKVINDVPNGLVPAAVLIDGFVGATWRLERERKHAVLHVATFGRVQKDVRRAVTDEGARLLALLAPDHETSVEVAPRA
ncbi:winged helix DNA-binding domain-containing protein [Sandaracinus amylolyticus]|uniref:Winged helix DNA-binding domain-containing protein n=1 Tax=Sandaracinus amylolyticus TaxID=927083 RepID=A0A0F6YKP6_9BACT|nr:winged helix DNA-binding domain-containing protein [Sandaracinus amylolyticus]AKF09391.1 hypothetical protein DB32_006540 [Sandaracinus amylolyticus]